MASTISAGTTTGTAIAIAGDTSGSLQLQTNGTTTAVTISTAQDATFAGKVTSAGALTLASNGTTTAVTIDTSQNVGIGTSSPQNPLTLQDIGGATFNRDVSIRNGDATNFHRLTLGYNAGALASGVPTSAQFLLAEKGGGYGTNGGLVVGNSDNAPVMFTTNGTEQARITAAGLLQFNSGYGSVATAYGCRAWVNFNGTGTIAIRASANVSSLTDNGTGDYTVNFTTAMVDANYAFAGGYLQDVGGANGTGNGAVSGSRFTGGYTTSLIRVATRGNDASGTALDPLTVTVAIFR